MNTALTQTRESIKKPVGVYIITIFDFIAVGLVQLIAIIWLNRQTEVELPFASFILRVSLAVLAMAASIWALARLSQF
jgi:heme/copper-type cytochrome/quinol oxidase subunit 4